MIIVDTFNVLHASSAPELSARLLGRLDPLRLAALVDVSRFRGQPAWLVCDGTGGGLASKLARAGASDAPGATLLFAGPGNEADAMIESILDRLEHDGRAHAVTVVSSDRRVQQAAIGVRARWMSSVQFLSAIEADLRRSHAAEHQRSGGRPNFAARDGLDDESAAAWLREFGFEIAPSLAQQSPNSPIPPTEIAPPAPGPDIFDAATLAELEEWARSLDSDDPSSGARGARDSRDPKPNR